MLNFGLSILYQSQAHSISICRCCLDILNLSLDQNFMLYSLYKNKQKNCPFLIYLWWHRTWASLWPWSTTAQNVCCASSNNGHLHFQHFVKEQLFSCVPNPSERRTVIFWSSRAKILESEIPIYSSYLSLWCNFRIMWTQ